MSSDSEPSNDLFTDNSLQELIDRVITEKLDEILDRLKDIQTRIPGARHG